MDQKSCISCKKRVANDNGSVEFVCPQCKKYPIIRCSKCREIVAKFKCPECGFEGP